ncbi:hypothetical protein LTR10_023066 [Elasticomyces elasticus]|uniref:Alpha/beta hydrolase fold-3 domain-containing protein n=1 Tax=Exophiala sideris TaxID=1016849 RepID=A0ABR0IUR3_9EURO|nr:hypothetical protein LTR10_023066 [Elasticomyces elasticus]KAK5021089.1 hypothetical protein LTS07_011242 [Exophiala sideris]KAK5023287.1 hypothetical protein LTR13_011277 [Exophiala sideris]KAK5048804.1 hypothetical protein LTR69_011267 [Exophiala sideris]KAK5176259.1 hypothetical protein LTR44_011190 [Eurotiomycetes sp. CCFEE 6388]
MASKKPQLTPADYLPLLISISRTVFSTAVSALTAFWRGASGAPSYKHHVLYAAMRAYTKYTTTSRLQATTPSTGELYGAFVKSKSLPHTDVVLADKTSAYWLGDKAADKLLLFFHGGGYVTAATDAHFQLLFDVVQQAQSRGKSLAVLVLEYDMAPAARYPTQVRQATYAFKYLMEDMKIPCSKILLAGDSAGGNLALALLSHIAHPSAAIAPVVKASQPLLGVFLLSPWVTFSINAPSMTSNVYKDCIDVETVYMWSRDFLGTTSEDNYNVPLNADPTWWSSLKVNDVCITAGRNEVFLDDIVAFANKMEVDTLLNVSSILVPSLNSS